MKKYSKLFKRVQAMILVVAMLLSVANLGLFLGVSAIAAGAEDTKSAGQLVAENYEGLSAAEKALLSSGYLVGDTYTYTAPDAEDDLIKVDIDNKKITAKEYPDGIYVWKPVSAQIMDGDVKKEDVALTNGVGTYSYGKNSFSVKVTYQVTLKVDAALQTTLLNAPAWLKQGINNMDKIATQDGNLYILEQAMPELVNFANNGITTSSGNLNLDDECKAAVLALNAQMKANGGKLNLSVVAEEYNAAMSKTNYLLTNGASVKLNVVSLVENVAVINVALATMADNMSLLIQLGLVSQELANQLKTLANVAKNLKDGLTDVAADPWSALDSQLVKDSGVNYTELDALVKAVNLSETKGATLAASSIKNPLLLDTTDIICNLNAYNVNVKVVLMTANGITGSADLKTAKVVDDKVFTFAKGTSAADIEAAAKDYVTATIAGMSTYGYVAEHFTISKSALPAGITADTEYVITITPNNYTIDFAYDADLTVPYGYKLLLAPHADVLKSYDYKVSGVNHAQSAIVTILGDTTVSREEGKAYEFITLAETVANNYFSGKTEAGILTSDAITLGKTVISARHPGQNDGLVSVSGDTLTAVPFASNYKGLEWQPYSYTVVNGGSRQEVLFNGSATLPLYYDSIEVSYRLTLTGSFEASEINALLALPAQLAAEAKAQKSVLDRLAAYGSELAQVNKSMLGGLNGAIDANDSVSQANKDFFKSIIKDMQDNCFDGSQFKLNTIIAKYNSVSDGGLEYYYKNSTVVLDEINKLSAYLDQMLADADKQAVLAQLCAEFGKPDYADKLTGLREKMAEIKADLTAPNALIDLTSGALDELIVLLTSDNVGTVPSYNGLLMFSDEKIEILSAGTISFKVSVNIAGQKPLTTDAIVFPKTHELAPKDIEMIINLVQEKINALGVSDIYYTNTNNYNEAIWTALIGQTADKFESAYAFTWTPKTATVVVEGMANQTISILNNKITLDASPSAAIRYEYYMDEVLISAGGSYTFTEAQLKAALASGTVSIDREEINVGTETLVDFVNNLNASVDNSVVSFALIENGAAYSIVMKINAGSAPNAMMSAIQETVMAMTLSGYGYIGMDDRGMIYLNTDGALEISLQTVFDAIMNSGFGTDTLINSMDAFGKINNMKLTGKVATDLPMNALGAKLIGTTLQLGDVAANSASYPFYITLGSASSEILQARNLFAEQLSSYIKVECADGMSNLHLTLPEKAYEAYLAALLVTDNVSLEDLNSINGKIAIGFIKDFFDPFFSEGVTANTLTNTLNLFGMNVNLTAYASLFDRMSAQYNATNIIYDKDSGMITRNIPIKMLFDQLDLGDLAKMIKEYDDGLNVTMAASLTNLNKNFEALYLDLRASGVTNKLGLTTNLQSKLNGLAGASVIVLTSDIDGDLVFSDTTVFNLNGFTVNGNVVSNGNLTIVDSSIGEKVGQITGKITGNVTITGGKYNVNVSSFLKSGYTQVDGVVSNDFYAFRKDADGNLTIELDAGMLVLDIHAVPDAKMMLIDLAFDMLFNGYTTNKLFIAGNQVYNIAMEDFVGIYTGENRIGTLADRIADMISTSDLSALVTTLAADLSDFGKLENAILNGTPLVSYDMTTASWNVALEHVVEGDYLSAGIVSGDDQVRKLYVVITGSKEDKQHLADIMGILDDTTDVDIKLEMNQGANATSKDVTLDWTASAEINIDLSKDHRFAVIFSMIAADATTGTTRQALINGIKDYYATGNIARLKKAFNSLTTAQMIAAVKSVHRSTSVSALAARLGLSAVVSEDLTMLEHLFSKYAVIVAAVLRRTDFAGGSRTLASFYDEGYGYGISRVNLDKQFARDLFRGYGVQLDVTITKLQVYIELFGEIVLNYSALEAKIAEAADITNIGYSADSWKALQDALAEARALLYNAKDQDEIDAMVEKLDAAIKALEELDYDALEAKIIEAAEKTDIGYTADSWNALKAALAEARALVGNAENQAQIEAMVEKLDAAIKALVKLNYDALNNKIDEAVAITNIGYTDDSWKALQTALANAIALLGNAKDQDEIDAMVDALDAAIKALVEEPVVEEPDYSALEDKITEAAGIANIGYTADSWNALQDALAEARALLGNAKDQDEINAMVEKLDAAIKALVEEPVVEEPEFVDGTGTPTIGTSDNILGKEIDTVNKTILLDTGKDGITKDTLKDLLNFNALNYDTMNVDIEDKGGLVYTGAKVTVTITSAVGTATIEYIVVILGDLDGDGRATAFDCAVIESNFFGTPLSALQSIAADVNNDSAINALDAAKIENKFFGDYESSLGA